MDVPTDPSDKDEDVTEPAELDLELLKETINTTRAATFQQALIQISRLWILSARMVVHQRNVESWALDIIYSTAGLRVGDKV